MEKNGYEYYLGHLLDATDDVELHSGASGYFSHPADRLDPNLFDGENIKASVRTFITDTYLSFWKRRLHYPERWSTIWLFGSGITYQWAADRGNGDLDCLIGIHWDTFYLTNQDFLGLTPAEVCDWLNGEMRTKLWPRTANTRIGQAHYEVTFYANPDGSNIADIKAYAAYDLTYDEWTIRPPNLPEDPHSLYPKDFYDGAAADTSAAQHLSERANETVHSIRSLQVGSPAWHNAMTELRSLLAQARTLLDEIHLGRSAAFGPGGSGYGDWANFRWQSAKSSGAISALSQLAALNADALTAEERELYGGKIDGAETALIRAALARTRYST